MSGILLIYIGLALHRGRRNRVRKLHYLYIFCEISWMFKNMLCYIYSRRKNNSNKTPWDKTTLFYTLRHHNFKVQAQVLFLGLKNLLASFQCAELPLCRVFNFDVAQIPLYRKADFPMLGLNFATSSWTSSGNILFWANATIPTASTFQNHITSVLPFEACWKNSSEFKTDTDSNKWISKT